MAYFKYENKNVYFNTYGNGEALIMIHGNSSSSKIFFKMAKIFSQKYKVVLIDLPGYGRSERVENLPIDFWYENAFVVVELMRVLGLTQAYILGSGGGAIVALNIALEFPDMVLGLVADSFEGENSTEWSVRKLESDRKKMMKMLPGRVFWKMMNGRDWKAVVEQDTRIIKEHHEKIKRYFHREIGEIGCPVLLIGGLKDRYIKDIKSTYEELEKRIFNSEVVLFENGRHPAIFYCAKDSVDIIMEYLQKQIKSRANGSI